MSLIKFNTIVKYIPILFCYSLFLWSCQAPSGKSKNETPIANPKSNTVKAVTSFEQWFKAPHPLISAHRGGPYPSFPENAIETFQNIVDQIPAIIECDVSMTKDSVLVLMHDNTLDRTTSGTGDISEHLYKDLKNLQLLDNEGDTTAYQIPTLDEVLAWGKGKTLFTLDVKRGVPFEKVIDAIEKFDANSYAAVIVYRIQDAQLIYSNNSSIVISVSAGSDGALEQIVKSGIPSKNLLGFVGTKEPEIAHYEKVQKLGIKTILGTLGNLDKSAIAKGDDNVYLTYIKNGANILATDRPLEAGRVLYAN